MNSILSNSNYSDYQANPHFAPLQQAQAQAQAQASSSSFPFPFPFTNSTKKSNSNNSKQSNSLKRSFDQSSQSLDENSESAQGPNLNLSDPKLKRRIQHSATDKERRIKIKYGMDLLREVLNSANSTSLNSLDSTSPAGSSGLNSSALLSGSGGSGSVVGSDDQGSAFINFNKMDQGTMMLSSVSVINSLKEQVASLTKQIQNIQIKQYHNHNTNNLNHNNINNQPIQNESLSIIMNSPKLKQGQGEGQEDYSNNNIYLSRSSNSQIQSQNPHSYIASPLTSLNYSLNSAGVCMWRVGLNGCLLEVNIVFERESGFPRNFLIGSHPVDAPLNGELFLIPESLRSYLNGFSFRQHEQKLSPQYETSSKPLSARTYSNSTKTIQADSQSHFPYQSQLIDQPENQTTRATSNGSILTDMIPQTHDNYHYQEPSQVHPFVDPSPHIPSQGINQNNPPAFTSDDDQFNNQARLHSNPLPSSAFTKYFLNTYPGTSWASNLDNNALQKPDFDHRDPLKESVPLSPTLSSDHLRSDYFYNGGLDSPSSPLNFPSFDLQTSFNHSSQFYSSDYSSDHDHDNTFFNNDSSQIHSEEHSSASPSSDTLNNSDFTTLPQALNTHKVMNDHVKQEVEGEGDSDDYVVVKDFSFGAMPHFSSKDLKPFINPPCRSRNSQPHNNPLPGFLNFMAQFPRDHAIQLLSHHSTVDGSIMESISCLSLIRNSLGELDHIVMVDTPYSRRILHKQSNKFSVTN